MSQSPVMLMKAVKSTKEIEGMKRAHVSIVSLSRFEEKNRELIAFVSA